MDENAIRLDVETFVGSPNLIVRFMVLFLRPIHAKSCN
jgi:hypothetical protein